MTLNVEYDFAETFQVEKKPGRTLLKTGAGLLQTRRPNKSEEDLLGHYSWLYWIIKERQAFRPQLGSAQPLPASA